MQLKNKNRKKVFEYVFVKVLFSIKHFLKVEYQNIIKFWFCF